MHLAGVYPVVNARIERLGMADFCRTTVRILMGVDDRYCMYVIS